MYFVLYTLISQRRTGLYTNLTGTSVKSVSFSHYGLLKTSKLFQQIVKICHGLVLRSYKGFWKIGVTVLIVSLTLKSSSLLDLAH